MTNSMHSTILRRMTGQRTDGADENPLTSSRALRLALTKAANDIVGLVLTVTSVAEEVQPLETMLAGLDEDLMLIELIRDNKLVGIVALDVQLRAAILEMQTVGSLIGAAADLRPATGTDKMMCDPVLAAFLDALPKAVVGTTLEGWADDVAIAQRIASSRAAGLVLDDHDYRILRLSVDLGVADRAGSILLALPPLQQALLTQTAAVEEPDWDSQFQASVAEAPASLEALLHRFSLPLTQARSLHVGQVVPLPGCTVNSVRLMTPDGHKLAEAKLGQIGGKRAVRIEAAPLLQMAELSGDVVGATGLADVIVGQGDPLALDVGGLTDAVANDPINFDEVAPADLPLDGGLDLPAGDDFPMMDMDAMSLTENS